MNITNTYDIIQTPKLIDLNGSSTKFECTYRVNSNDPFYLAAVNQKMLDGDIKYQAPNIYFEGSVKYDRNEHLPHYLVLKADKNCKVNVTIKTTPLSAPITMNDYKEKIPESKGVTFINTPQPHVHHRHYNHQKPLPLQAAQLNNQQHSTGKYVLIGVLCCFMLFILWSTKFSSKLQIEKSIPNIPPMNLLDKLKSFPIV